MEETNRATTSYKLPHILLFMGLIVLALSLLNGSLLSSSLIAISPIALFGTLMIIKKPAIGLFALFFINYFLLGITRYFPIDGVSVIMDISLLLLFVCILFNILAGVDFPWERVKKNPLVYLWLIWLIYTVCEILNPTAMLNAWILTRGLMYNAVITVFLTALLIDKTKYIKILFFILSVFTLLAICKAFGQKFFGFDAAEWAWLERDGGKTHLIATGVRYFSFFTDAGNFGSNMGFALVAYMILAIYVKNNVLRIYYFVVSILAGYAMFLSGTRGAMIVPLGGLAMYIILNKNIKGILGGGLTLLIVYIFFAFTYIGEGNEQIRRMRTAFKPTKDASYLVRKENQRRLATYMRHRPFGEGLGLAGVSGMQFSYRFTTSIPTDSHYVSIWVQCGIIGLLLHIGILLFVIVYSGYIIMFRIRNKELKGLLIAMNCGVFGLMLSAYGNNFFGQFPTGMIVNMCQTFLVLGEYFDKEIENNKHIQTQTTEL